MTPEQLLGLPKPIAELTDDELVAHLTRFFPATRPRKPLTFGEVRAGKASDTVATAITSASGGLNEKIANAFKAAGLDASGNLLRQPTKRNFTQK